MEQGTFGLQGAGSEEDPKRPDFETGPTGPLGYIPQVWEQIAATETTVTVRYQPN